MSDTPIFDQTAARLCAGMSDDTLAFLANKLDENTYTIRTAGGDLSLTDKSGLLSFLKTVIGNEEAKGGELEGLPAGGPRPTRRDRQIRDHRRVDHLRNTVTPAGVAEGPPESRGGSS